MDALVRQYTRLVKEVLSQLLVNIPDIVLGKVAQISLKCRIIQGIRLVEPNYECVSDVIVDGAWHEATTNLCLTYVSLTIGLVVA